MVSIRLTEDIKTIEGKINKAIAEVFNKQLRRGKTKLVTRTKALVETWVRTSPAIISLETRQPRELMTEFGIRRPVTEAIVQSIVAATEIRTTYIDSRLNGHITFNFQPKSFINLLGMPEGHVITGKGSDLHWMEWLLRRGDQIIITGYQYSPSREGRAGGGIMVAGNSFRVNPAYSGTEDNNFITKMFSGREKDLQNLIIGLFNV